MELNQGRATAPRPVPRRWGSALLLLLGAVGPAPAVAQEFPTLPDGRPCRRFAVEFTGDRPPGWSPLPPCEGVEAAAPNPRTNGHTPGGDEGRGDTGRGEPATPPRTDASAGRRGASQGDSRSVGLTNDGRLVSGVRIEESEQLRYVPSEVRGRDGGRFWGTRELVDFIERLARHTARQNRGAPLSIGELSAREGGSIPGHRSHQAGRDFDVAFFLRDERGRRAVARDFVRIGEQGVSRRRRGGRLRFDAEANWKLVAALLADRRVNVQFIFVAEHLQWLLLEEAARQRAPYELIQRARAALREPEEHAHDNHFHIRIFCARNDFPRCRDDAPRTPLYGHRRRGRGEMARARQRARRLGLGTHRAAVTALRRTPPSRWTREIRGMSPSYLQWPVTRGYYNRGFGFTREDHPDIPHNGVDVGAPQGSVVRASADGLVVYAAEFRSFGNVVFLVHKNGWVTTYAHNLRNTVIAGELVRRGHPIGLVGSTGISRGPHVHYEMRDRGHVRDPEELLRGVRRWTDSHGPPQRLVSTVPEAGEDAGEERRAPVRLPTRIESADDPPEDD